MKIHWSVIEVLEMLSQFANSSIHIFTRFDPMKVKVYPIFYYFLSRANVSISLSDGQCANVSSASRDDSSIHFSFHCKTSNPVGTLRKKWKMIRLRLKDCFIQSQLTSVVFLERKEQKRKNIPTIFVTRSPPLAVAPVAPHSASKLSHPQWDKKKK